MLDLATGVHQLLLLKGEDHATVRFVGAFARVHAPDATREGLGAEWTPRSGGATPRVGICLAKVAIGGELWQACVLHASLV